MIMRSRPALTYLCTLAAIIATGAITRASYRELESPRLSLSDYSADDYKQLDAVLKRADCKFLGGAELNRASSLRYSGDTIALNKFIAALSLCPKVEVHVNFFRPHGGAVEADWMVTQMAPSHELVVRVNLAADHVDIEKLYLPPVKADKAPD